MIEGDGCLTKNSITLTGTRIMCDRVVEVIKDNLGVSPKDYGIYNLAKTHSNIVSLSFNKTGINQQILQWLYLDCNYYMERKYNKYLALIKG